jgi:hypothetical protein
MFGSVPTDAIDNLINCKTGHISGVGANQVTAGDLQKFLAGGNRPMDHFAYPTCLSETRFKKPPKPDGPRIYLEALEY